MRSGNRKPIPSPSWKEAARNARFRVNPTIYETTNSSSGRTNTSTRHGQAKRNRFPCSRCATLQKKVSYDKAEYISEKLRPILKTVQCDIEAPYNLGRCKECTKADIPSCPPHIPRRWDNKSANSTEDYPRVGLCVPGKQTNNLQVGSNCSLEVDRCLLHPV